MPTTTQETPSGSGRFECHDCPATFGHVILAENHERTRGHDVGELDERSPAAHPSL